MLHIYQGNVVTFVPALNEPYRGLMLRLPQKRLLGHQAALDLEPPDTGGKPKRKKDAITAATDTAGATAARTPPP